MAHTLTNILGNWNFKDEAANSTLQQVNRQKSARNLEVLQFDPSEPCAVFLDAKAGAKHAATLTHCDCHDFNMAGPSPRKVFKPCMHIYRLAMELGLIEAKYLDRDARSGLASAHAAALAREETQRLQRLPFDSSQWGGWSSGIHCSGIQKNRQYRAYAIKLLEPGAIRVAGDGWIIHDYSVSISLCDCMDFRERKLPCKHIYAAALLARIDLPLTFAEYDAARKAGLAIVFDFRSSQCLTASIFVPASSPGPPPAISELKS